MNQEGNYWQNSGENNTSNVNQTTHNTANDNQTEGNRIAADNDQTISWKAKEYLDFEKDTLWFVIFGIIAIILISLDLLFFKSYTFSILVVVMAVAVVVLSKRPPKDIRYTLSDNYGLYIENRLYPISDFKAFGLIDDTGSHSFVLIPRKRFSPSVVVYFPEDVGERVVDILGSSLPMEKVQLDLVDKIVRRLHL
jgi:hypothetical protein